MCEARGDAVIWKHEELKIRIGGPLAIIGMDQTDT